MRFVIFIGLISSLLAACSADQSSGDALAMVVAPTDTIKKTTAAGNLGKEWYQGKAEISSYELEQVRYRDVHPGEAVLVFVTEDFLTDKQVKNDNYTNKNSTPILKNNFIRRFSTGLYDYSVMTSVFTPTETKKYEQTQKVTFSAQDWCGQSFMQFNHQKNKYKVQLRSYFENEGDRDFTVDDVLLEDELFNRIRMNPDGLPTGQVKIIPSATYLRLKHVPTEAVTATISKLAYNGTDFDKPYLMEYRVEMGGRVLSIVYQKSAPYVIEGWSDAYRAGSGEQMTTRARRQKTIWSPYWQQNSLQDVSERKSLELVEFD